MTQLKRSRRLLLAALVAVSAVCAFGFGGHVAPSAGTTVTHIHHIAGGGDPIWPPAT